MTALTDIQRALNAIREIERGAAADTRLAALQLITSTAADIARELRGEPKQKQAKRAPKPPAAPPPPPQPKPQPTPQVAPEPRPFTEPEREQR